MVNAKAPSSFFDLVQGMKGKSTIGNWDVLVTYDEETLNKRLAEQADASKALEELKVETSVMNLFPRKQIPVHSILKLSSPVLSFGPGDSEAHLRLNLAGSYTIDKEPEVNPLPNEFLVNIRVTLNSAVGHFDGIHFKKSEAAGAEGVAGMTLAVPDDPNLVCGLYLDFPTGSTDWRLEDKAGNPAVGDKASEVWQLVAQGIQSFLSAQGSRWFVGGVKQSTASPNDVTLIPETVRFTTLRADPANKESKSAVCIWVKVKDSQGQANGTEGFNKFESHPIPKDRTASVVFSHSLLVYSVLKPSLENTAAKWMDNVRTALQNDGDADEHYNGVHLKGRCILSAKDDLSFFKEDELQQDIDIKIDSNIVLAESPSLTLTYDSKMHTEDKVVMLNPIPFMDPVKMTTYRQLQIRGAGTWSGQGTEIDMATTVSQNVKYRVTASGFWETEAASGNTDPISMTCNVKPLQYLLATNLLFPNKHIFSADPVQAPKKSAQDTILGGLACPHDLILTGNLVEKVTAI